MYKHFGEEVKVGDKIRHRGTKQWGIVTEIIEISENDHEIVVDRIVRGNWDQGGPSQWAGYHVDRHEARKVEVPPDSWAGVRCCACDSILGFGRLGGYCTNPQCDCS